MRFTASLLNKALLNNIIKQSTTFPKDKIFNQLLLLVKPFCFAFWKIHSLPEEGSEMSVYPEVCSLFFICLLVCEFAIKNHTLSI